MKKKSIFVILLLIVILICTQNNYQAIANASEHTDTKIKIFSNGIVSVLPDNAEIQLGIEYTSSNETDAKNITNIKLNNIKSALKDFDEELVNLKINNIYCYPLNVDFENVYKSTIDASIKVKDLSLLVDIINNIENIDARIYNINYSISNQDKAYNLAIIDAIKKAHIKINELFPDTNVKLTKIEEEYNYCMPCYYRDYNVETIHTDINTPIEINARILAEFEII